MPYTGYARNMPFLILQNQSYNCKRGISEVFNLSTTNVQHPELKVTNSESVRLLVWGYLKMWFTYSYANVVRLQIFTELKARITTSPLRHSDLLWNMLVMAYNLWQNVVDGIGNMPATYLEIIKKNSFLCMLFWRKANEN